MSLKRKADLFEEEDGTEDMTRVLKRSPRSPRSASPPSLPQQHQIIPTQFLQFLKLPPLQQDSSRHPPLSSVSSVSFQKPSIITTFSYSPNRDLLFDNSALKFFVQPPPRADLAHRYSTWSSRPEEKGRLDSLLRAVASSGATQGLSQAVVTWRGVMCKIIVAPYEEKEGWSINVMQLNGVLYFEQHLTDAQLEAKNNLEPRLRQFTYYGYAFESWCTSPDKPSPHRRPAWGGDVDTAVQWCAVVKTKLADTRLVLGGEVDCVRDAFTGDTDSFVELKTSIAPRPHNAADQTKFEKKLLKFYFQSFLLGVPEVLVGFRSPRGILQHTQPFRTLELPRLVRNKPGAWDPHLCLRWADLLLDRVRAWMLPLAPSDVGRILFTPETGQVTFSRLDHAQIHQVVAGEDRVGFLPTWYYTQSVNEPKPPSPLPS